MHNLAPATQEPKRQAFTQEVSTTTVCLNKAIESLEVNGRDGWGIQRKVVINTVPNSLERTCLQGPPCYRHGTPIPEHSSKDIIHDRRNFHMIQIGWCGCKEKSGDDGRVNNAEQHYGPKRRPVLIVRKHTCFESASSHVCGWGSRKAIEVIPNRT